MPCVANSAELLLAADDGIFAFYQLSCVNHARNVFCGRFAIPRIILPLGNPSCSDIQPNSAASTFFSYITFSYIFYVFACRHLLFPSHAFASVPAPCLCNSTGLKLLLLAYEPPIFHRHIPKMRRYYRKQDLFS